VGIGLRYIIESVKADAPSLKINRVVKDEVREAAGISISSLDKYLGEVFQNDRPIDPSTLEKLASKLFYYNKPCDTDSLNSGSQKYLKQKHIGILGKRSDTQDTEHFISNLIAFIKTKPLLIEFIQDNVQQAKYPEFVNRIFQFNSPHVIDAVTLGTQPVEPSNLHRVVPKKSRTRAPIIAALSTLLLGILLPVFVMAAAALDRVLVLDYLIHDPGKHFFHIVLFPCMVWAFLRCVQIERLLPQKKLFLILMSAGFLLSFSQTYVQHSQSICDLVTSDYICNDIVERLFDRSIFDTLFLLYTSFLSLIPSLFSIIVFACQLLELRNRGQEICSAVIYSTINISFLIWAVSRSYSEWHEVALSFDKGANSDFAIYRYQSFLITATMLIISQILILIQTGRNRNALSYLSLFLIVNSVSFWLVTNIHVIALKFHSIAHIEFSTSNSVSLVLGPLIYLYLIAIVIIFTYTTIVSKVGSNR